MKSKLVTSVAQSTAEPVVIDFIDRCTVDCRVETKTRRRTALSVHNSGALVFSILFACEGYSATWYLNENETAAVGSSVGSNPSAGPYYFEYWCPGSVTCRGETATYQSLSPRTGGGKYVRFTSGPLQHDYGFEARNPTGLFGETLFSAASEVPWPNGSTRYLAFFVRYSRINGVDVFHDNGTDADSYSKMLEVNGPNLRLMVLSGWPSSSGAAAVDHKYSFWTYVSPTYCPSCGPRPGVVWPAEMPQNFPPHDVSNNPYLCDYEKWYAVVLKMVISSDYSGLLELSINGTKVSSYRGRTVETASTTFNRIFGNGTIAQPAYDNPGHHFDLDGLILTDDLPLLQSRGYFSNPEAGGSARLPPPLNVRTQ